MIDVYYWPTPNGHKVTLFLEEADLPYKLIPVNIGKGDQFQPDFLRVSPNNRIPAIIDNQPISGGEPIAIFESGAILLYLAEKSGKYFPTELKSRFEVLQWLFWQVGGLGPMAGQNHHFTQYAPETIPYAIDRYITETRRLYSVLEKRLADRPYLAGGYSIADMACFPWVVPHEKQNIDLDEFPSVRRWFEQIKGRPAVERAYERGHEFNPAPALDDQAKRILFGHSSDRSSGALPV